jgi:hypothetical protein
MTERDMPEAGNRRREFLRNAAVSLGFVGSASAQSRRNLSLVAPGSNASFGAIKQVDAGLLNVGYAEAGPGGCR